MLLKIFVDVSVLLCIFSFDACKKFADVNVFLKFCKNDRMAQLVQWNEIDLKGYLPLSSDDSDDFLVKLQ